MPQKRKIIVEVAISADGFLARADGSVDWLDSSRLKGDYGMGEFYKSIDTIVFGRKTYEVALAFQASGVPGSAFDARIKNYVFSRTLSPSDAPPAVEITSAPVKAFASRLRGEKGKNIWMMGGVGII